MAAGPTRYLPTGSIPSALILAALSWLLHPGSSAPEAQAQATSQTQPEGPAPVGMLQPQAPAAVASPELAPLMSELQRFTHKLALSVEAGNRPLAEFYNYEALGTLQRIQNELPEYEGYPIAVLVDTVGRPPFEALQEQLRQGDGRAEQRRAVGAVIKACNDCHASTQHGFIRITAGTDNNPYNQEFRPQ